ncbi:MAG: methyltransferase domain-containing protein [Rhizobiaceae bacterium]|nr:methyltransferase domain-containing protein [Rhizobiaceae bacterium]
MSTDRPRARARLRDDLRFFRRWLADPKTTGSIVPTSWTMAQKMASVADPASPHPVLELGPGTGIVTRAILARGVAPARIVSLEYAPNFVERLRADFPGVDVVQGDAFDLRNSLGRHAGSTFDCAISSLPLLNFPMEKRIALMEDLLDRVAPGRPVIQFTYGLAPSVPRGRGSYSVERHAVVLRNVPPAHLWIYRRPA